MNKCKNPSYSKSNDCLYHKDSPMFQNCDKCKGDQPYGCDPSYDCTPFCITCRCYKEVYEDNIADVREILEEEQAYKEGYTKCLYPHLENQEYCYYKIDDCRHHRCEPCLQEGIIFKEGDF